MRKLGIALTSILAAVTLFSAVGKLLGLEDVEQLLDDVGVDGVLRDMLPFIQIAGAIGAIAGLIRWPGLGIVATFGLFAYYAGAVVFHLRADATGYGFAAGYAVLALLAAGLRTRTAVVNRPGDRHRPHADRSTRPVGR